MSGNVSLTIEKAPHGNRYVICKEYQTGIGRRGEGQVWRSDIYTFNGRRFTFDDAEFPETFRKYIKEAQATLRDYPGDYDLRQNLAYMYSITGRPQKSGRILPRGRTRLP